MREPYGPRNQDSASREDIQHAIDILRAGGVIAIPTDTVYGIAAALDHPDAIERIFDIKGRSGTKAIPVLVSDRDALGRLSVSPPEAARKLADAFWPGGLTIVVEAADTVPNAVLREGTTVGLRMPDNADALAVIAGCGGALAVTSANPSGEPEARSAGEVRRRLGGRLDFVVDGGPSGIAAPSTVVDATREQVRVLRAGAIDARRIFSALENGAVR